MYDKWPEHARRAAMKWEEDAIEECRNDPRIAELGLCYVCLTKLPDCLCTRPKKEKTVERKDNSSHGWFRKLWKRLR